VTAGREPVPIYHVRFTCAPDYMARRLPFRPAHLAQLAGLRDDGRVIAGGPEPDGSAAHIFYRVPDPDALDALLADNVFYRAKLFVAHQVRPFTDVVLPLAPLPADAGLKVTLVEGRVSDWARASAALVRLQREERIGFGGKFADGTALAAVRSPDASEAIDWLVRAEAFTGAPTARAWSQTL
jgi:uncharacterized protein YciI